MLLAEWKDAPEYGRSYDFVSYCMTRGGLVLLINYYDFLSHFYYGTCFQFCAETFTTVNGSLHTPSWPEYYPQNFNCDWTIYLSGSSEVLNKNVLIVFTINSTAISISSNCSVEYKIFLNEIHPTPVPWEGVVVAMLQPCDVRREKLGTLNTMVWGLLQ